MKRVIPFLFFLLPFSLQFSNAQMYANRNSIMNPFADTVAQSGFMPSFHYSHEFAKGFGSAGGEQAWNGRSVGFIEFYRWESGWSFGGMLAAEAGLNDSNDIGFNPRSVRWMEELAVFKKQELFTWKLGVQHQCKHDVDNSDGASGDTPIANSTKRVTILSGLNAEIFSNQVSFGSDFVSRAVLRTDYYFSAKDYRFPKTTEKGSFMDAYGAVLLKAKIIYKGFSPLEIHADGWFGSAFLKENTEQIAAVSMENAYRFEMGVSGRGRAGALTVFGAFEHYFDDFALPVPQQSDVFYIGLRGSSSIFF
ncbi:MAG: hypothetical protein V4642_04900 [Bacteroidota bacterium]